MRGKYEERGESKGKTRAVRGVLRVFNRVMDVRGTSGGIGAVCEK